MNVGWKEGRKVERTRAHRENFCVFFIFSLIKLDVGKFLSFRIRTSSVRNGNTEVQTKKLFRKNNLSEVFPLKGEVLESARKK